MKIAIMGLGVVGRGVYDIITSRFAPEIEVKTILDLLPLEELHCIHAKSIDEIVNDPEIELVVEAMGGLHPASDFVLKALRAGKHVVTPNKQMVSTIFAELQQAAAENGVKILFTPSAGGGIPWLYNLVRTKRCGGIEAFRGIINGTTNFILDSMEKSGADFADILKEAQRLGYAEANPSADIDGIDIQRKCAISSNLAFDVQLDPARIDTAGIRRITGEDIRAFRENGLHCRLLCNGEKLPDGKICAYVEPVLLKEDAMEGHVPANFNMVFLKGPEVGELGFFGQGAGRYPTAHSLVEDILDIRAGLGYTGNGPQAEIDNRSAVHAYYVRTEDPALRAMAREPFGPGFLTGPVSVAEMHGAVRAAEAAGHEVFFAAVRA